MENKNHPTSADKLKKQGAYENQLNNNPGNTSTGGGQSDQYDKLNYGPSECYTCKEDFDKNIDSMVGQVENHGPKEHGQQEHEVTAAFGKEHNGATKTGTNTNKSFDNYGNASKPSGGYPDPDKKGDKEKDCGYDGKNGPYDRTNKTGIYGQPDKNTPVNKTGTYNRTDKNAPYGHNVSNNDPSDDWKKGQNGPTYGHNTQTETKQTPGKSGHAADYPKSGGKKSE